MKVITKYKINLTDIKNIIFIGIFLYMFNFNIIFMDE